MAEACDVIFLCVFDTAAVEEVVFGPVVLPKVLKQHTGR